jgi:hypothetical protein
MYMERRHMMMTGGAVMVGAVIIGSGGLEGAPKNTEQPKPAGTEYVCDTDPNKTVTFEAGDTVTERVAEPLARELGITIQKALKLAKKANPGVNINKVGVSQVFNVPTNCELE